MSHLPLSVDDVARLLVAEGATGWTVVTMGAICAAESGRDAYAVNVNGNPKQSDGKPNPAYRSLDIGLFQINTYWYSTHLIVHLLNPTYNTATALSILESGGIPDGYNSWNVYKAGAYRPYVPECRQAANRIGVKV